VTTSAQTVTVNYNDTAGGTDLGVVNVLINAFLNGNNSCYLAYSRPQNVLYLVNDAGNALLPGMVLNGTGSLSNGQCTITGAGTTAVVSGNTLTLTLNLTMSQSYQGSKVIWAAARTMAEVNSGWQAMGTWTVP
jgi:hypothetical protein